MSWIVNFCKVKKKAASFGEETAFLFGFTKSQLLKDQLLLKYLSIDTVSLWPRIPCDHTYLPNQLRHKYLFGTPKLTLQTLIKKEYIGP